MNDKQQLQALGESLGDFQPFTSIEDAKPAPDMVNHPPHYQSDSGIECIDAIRSALGGEQYIGYLRGACMKYIWRYNNKGGLESLKKASWYLNRMISHYEEEESKNK